MSKAFKFQMFSILTPEVESSRTHFEVLGLGLGLEGQVLGLGLEASSPRKLGLSSARGQQYFLNC